jgi:glycosyltransferase involved in cell wall biosynthesis
MHAPSPSNQPLRIALVAPPMKAVPPDGYGGTERVVDALATGLVARGHDVTVFATGDSHVAGRLVPIRDESLWKDGYKGDVSSYMQIAAAKIWAHADEFDVIHSHLETHGFLFSRHCATPVVSTLHGRLDDSGAPELLDEFRDIPLVAISANQRRWFPDQNWVATIHHGQDLTGSPFREEPGEYLAVVGRLAPEKGIEEAIELARRTGRPLKMAAKALDPQEIAMGEELVKPAVEEGVIEFLGELGPHDRDELMAGGYVTLMLGSWPEPFGLVAIESMATGTPVIGRRTGALPEIVEEGVDGFLVDDLGEAILALDRIRDLDRAEIRRRTLERFSVDRMTADYEAVYRSLIAERRGAVTSATAGRLPTPRKRNARPEIPADAPTPAPTPTIPLPAPSAAGRPPAATDRTDVRTH